ncbi:VanZ family protein [Flavobacterium sp. J27]|uniref:VanZ family protein n=1 Tax=Flavobacterium sp. J27 TaxID=2060419 RepID=UPI0010325D67|nr:VanZ family protein [Flavobacterium sp. J27]
MKITQLLSGRNFLYLAIVWTLVVAYLCLMSMQQSEVLVKVPYKDKIVHFTFYFLLFFLWKKGLKVKGLKSQIKIVLVLVMYGIILEVFQEIFTSDRQGDVFDALANTLGAVTSLIFLKFVDK